MSELKQRRWNWVLPVYGWYALAAGIADFLRGGLMVFSSSVASETQFVGHLTQAHAGTVIGLGCVALGVRHVRANLRPIHVAILIANLLGAIIYARAAHEGHGILSLLVAVTQLFWVICFTAILLGGSRPELAGVRAPRLFDRLVGWSFSFLVTFSGVMWILAPLKFATAAAGSLAGVAAVFAGQTRGAADVGMGMVAALLGMRRESAIQRALAGALFVSNLALAVAGLLAQLSVLYTPARWVVEGLHIVWSVGFGWLWLRLRATPRA